MFSILSFLFAIVTCAGYGKTFYSMFGSGYMPKSGHLVELSGWGWPAMIIGGFGWLISTAIGGFKKEEGLAFGFFAFAIFGFGMLPCMLLMWPMTLAFFASDAYYAIVPLFFMIIFCSFGIFAS